MPKYKINVLWKFSPSRLYKNPTLIVPFLEKAMRSLRKVNVSFALFFDENFHSKNPFFK